MVALKYFLLGCVLLIISSCGTPSEGDVETDFLKKYPEAEILSVGAGEGDGGAVYMHIKYKLPNSNSEREQVWQYLDKGGPKWELNHTETVR